MATKNPIEFLREVRQEARKVTWPERRATLANTGIVFVFVVIASLFFTVADLIISSVVRLFLGVS